MVREYIQGLYKIPCRYGRGVGGTPESFVRAGLLGLPLMVAIRQAAKRIGSGPFIDLYRQAGRRAGYSSDQLKVGVHSLGYVAESTQEEPMTSFQAMHIP